jgi:hypothetical protein
MFVPLLCVGGEAPAEAPEGWYLGCPACCRHCWTLEGGRTRAPGPIPIRDNELHLCE